MSTHPFQLFIIVWEVNRRTATEISMQDMESVGVWIVENVEC